MFSVSSDPVGDKTKHIMKIKEYMKFFEKVSHNNKLKCIKYRDSIFFIMDELPGRTMGTVVMTYAEVETMIELLQEAIGQRPDPHAT